MTKEINTLAEKQRTIIDRLRSMGKAIVKYFNPWIKPFKPWKYSVIRFIGTERSNCDEMVKYINHPYIVPISYSAVQVDKRFIGTLIFKHK